MRFLSLLNCMLAIGFLAVVAGTVFVVGCCEYSDDATHSIFVLHAVNGCLLLLRAVWKG